MNLLEFNRRFPDEASCREYLRVQREAHGITCKKCGGTHHYWLKAVEVWQCAGCKSRTNLRAGTLLEKSKLPVLYWFMAIHLMTSTKKTFSALELQRQLGHKFYEPIWYMMQKIRKAMGKRDSQYMLQGEIEMDDAYFEIVDLPEKDELGNIKREDGDDGKQKRGRGSQCQQSVLVMVESTPNPAATDKHKPKRKMGFVKMVVMEKMDAYEINYTAKKLLDSQSKVITDAYRGFVNLKDIVAEHKPEVTPSKEAHKKLPWVHTVIGNAKRLLGGLHHSTGREYLQNYLDEFCYKLNRRNFQSDLFDRMIIAGVSDTWY